MFIIPVMLGREEYITAEPLISDPSYLQVEIAIAKLEKYKSPCSDQIWTSDSCRM
jgi:hypothetical protein